MSRTSRPGDVGITCQSVKNQDGVCLGLVELTKRLVGDAHVREGVAMLGREATHLSKRSLAEVVAVPPGSCHRRGSAQGRLHSLRDESGGQ